MGIVISAKPDGSTQTNLAQLPGCGDFGPTLSPPNIIGGGTGPGSLGWRESVRFDFPSGATAIGASSDWTGSNTTLTAYSADGTVIASVTGDQGNFMGIAEPGIAYAVWKWNYDEAVAGFSLDNVTFAASLAGVPDPSPTASFEAGPNPFHSEAWIHWSSRVGGHVRVAIYDVGGHRVATLVDEVRAPGDGMARWGGVNDQGARVPTGVYFVRLELPSQTLDHRLVRIR
jgi:hypothetical protein